MAKLECTVNGDFDAVLSKITDGIENGSMTSSLEDQSDYRIGDTRCSVRVFELRRKSGNAFQNQHPWGRELS